MSGRAPERVEETTAVSGSDDVTGLACVAAAGSVNAKQCCRVGVVVAADAVQRYTWRSVAYLLLRVPVTWMRVRQAGCSRDADGFDAGLRCHAMREMTMIPHSAAAMTERSIVRCHDPAYWVRHWQSPLSLLGGIYRIAPSPGRPWQTERHSFSS